ncbi:MAG: RidA family protein [Bacteroidales bacterium]
MKRIISTPLAPAAIGPYSQAVEVNGFLYVSGQIPLDPVSGEIVGSDITTQTEQVLKNIGSILTAAGYSFGDVVKTTCLLADMGHFSAMNKVYGSFFVADQPARAAFAVATLPREVLIEIELIASKA